MRVDGAFLQEFTNPSVYDIAADGSEGMTFGPDLANHLQSINEELDLAEQLSNVYVIIAGGGDELLTNDPSQALPGVEVFGTSRWYLRKCTYRRNQSR